MRLRHFVQTAAFALAAAAAVPAMAHDGHEPGAPPPGADMRPQWKEGRGYSPPSMDPRARDEWLAECRHRISVSDNGVGGAVIGGIIGGVAGNRIAGRGHRTVGTVAGAAVGAIAGAAIDKAEDQGQSRDRCEAYLDDYYAHYAYAGPGYGYGAQAYGGGYGCCQQPMMMVPVYTVPGEPDCKETVEYVYEDVPVRPRARRISSKRVKIVPDKRIRIK